MELKAETEDDSSGVKAMMKPSGAELTYEGTEAEDCSASTGSTSGPLLVVGGGPEELEGPAMANTNPSGEELGCEAEEAG